MLKESRIDLLGFYIRRFWRIFPPLYALFVFVAISRQEVSLYDFLRSVTFTVDYDLQGVSRTLGHLWSLSVEEQFYLLWPPVLAWYSTKRGVKIAAAVVIAVPLIRLAEHQFGFRLAGIGWEFHTVADAIAIGCLLAFRQNWVSLRTVGVCLLVLFLSFKFHYSDIFGKSAINVLIACALYYCLTHRITILNWKPVVHVGMLSYSLYLWQQLFVFTMNPLIAISVTILCAQGSYMLIEKPCISFGRKWAQGRRKEGAHRIKLISGEPEARGVSI